MFDAKPIYEELKSWQSLLGTVFGFVALVIGALLNFHLNRRRDDRLRAEQMRSVSAALYGEILLLRIEVGRMARNLAGIEVKGSQEISESFLEAHVLSEPVIYKALSTQIGHLDADLIIAITSFYKNYSEAKTWLPLLLPTEKRKYDYSFSAVLEPARNAVVEVIPALRKIEKMVGISTSAIAVDLGYTEAVIEQDELQRSS